MNGSDFDNQLKQWESSAKGGDAKASLLLANHFHDLGDMVTAFHWYVHASKQQDINPIVYFYLGYAYQYGEGTPVDMIEAFTMYKKAATYDVPQALYSLAYFYQNGIVVPRDELSAVSYMKQATQKMDTLFLMQYDSNAEKERLRAEVALQKEAVDALHHQNEELLKENGQLSEQLVQEKNKTAESDKDRVELKQQLKLAEQQFQIYKKKLTDQYDQKFLELRQQAIESQTKNDLLNDQNSKLHEELQKITDLDAGFQKEIENRDQMIREYERRIEECKQSAIKSNHQYEQCYKELVRKNQSIQEYVQRVEECERLASESNLQYARCYRELERSRAEIEKLARAIFKMTYWIDGDYHRFAGRTLSVFSKYTFVIDGIVCSSVESFLQSLKFKNINRQREICSMPPERAGELGDREKGWIRTGDLWWKGNVIKRSGSEYQDLLNRVYGELFKNSEFTGTLLDCGNIEILRTGDTENSQSVILTEDEFVSRLVSMRNLLQRR